MICWVVRRSVGDTTLSRCRRQCIEVRSVDQSTQSAETFSAFIFQLSGWALMAPSCFALQVPGVRGLQARGRHVLLSCSNFAHECNMYIHIGYTRLWSHPQAVRFQAMHGISHSENYFGDKMFGLVTAGPAGLPLVQFIAVGYPIHSCCTFVT